MGESRKKTNMTNNLNQQLEELVHSLQKQNELLAWNDEYGCYTRQGFEMLKWPEIMSDAKWIIYFDIDDMRKLNEIHGHAGVNALIKKSLAVRESDFLAGQRYSGDEFIVVITDTDPERRESNPIELALRLAVALRENGVSATFGFAPVVSDNLTLNVEPAVHLVEVAKQENRRNSIGIVPGDPR